MRPPINPQGYYHIGSRGTYGRTLFPTEAHYEIFLRMYTRASGRYQWETLEWTTRPNHHHFVVRLTNGGLSSGLRELHGGYSRWFHEQYGLTGQGHLFRHGFFARELTTEEEVLGACVYVALNPVARTPNRMPEEGDWCGYRANIGLEHPRRFHSPARLLELLDSRPDVARDRYRELVHQRHADRRHVPSPNDGGDPVVESLA